MTFALFWFPGASRSGFLRPFDQLLDAPALVARQRAGLDDEHAIAGLVLVLLVVRLVLRAARHVLAVLGVRQAALDQHDARLLHLVAGDDADELAALDLAALTTAGGGVGVACGTLHRGGRGRFGRPRFDVGHCLFLLRRSRFRCRLLPDPLGQHGVHAGDVPPRVANQHRVLELVGGLLQLVLEEVLLQLAHGALQLRRLVAAEILRANALAHSTDSRPTKRVCTASLCSARWNASRARSSFTPSSSYITRPGRTTATHSSGLPLPLPIRVSAGFFEIGLSGKMRM